MKNPLPPERRAAIANGEEPTQNETAAVAASLGAFIATAQLESQLEAAEAWRESDVREAKVDAQRQLEGALRAVAAGIEARPPAQLPSDPAEGTEDLSDAELAEVLGAAGFEVDCAKR